MHAYVIFAHPTRQSFSGSVLEALCRGLADGGHSFEVGDLYATGFRGDMALAEYQREMNVRGDRADSPRPKDVEEEHREISRADGNTADALEQSGVASSMKRIYTNDRLTPGAGVGQCEFVLLPGMADPETAPQAKERNLAAAYRLGRDFLTAAAP